MLKSLEIRNFRTFSHVRIKRLGRVNLVVGKNNVGKTCLVEALRLYGSSWPRSTIAAILDARDEVFRSADERSYFDLGALIHGRGFMSEAFASEQQEVCFLIGPLEVDPSLSFQGKARLETGKEGGWTPGTLEFRVPSLSVALTIHQFGRTFQLSEDGSASYSIPTGTVKPPEISADPPFLWGVGGHERTRDVLPRWWDQIALTDGESRVIETLKAATPIQGVSFVSDPRNEARRIAKVRAESFDQPVSLARLGDGVVRMFHIAVALEFAAIYAQGAIRADASFKQILPMLLIDEVETGLHHTLHKELWRFILRTSRLLGVQVFATTHSLDCLRGFAQAVAEDEEADALAIRLEKVEGEERTGAVIIDRDDLPIVIRDSIEVR